MKKKIIRLIDEKIIRHFRESHAPIHELSLGSVVGFFWALTPLIGIQMGLVTLTWLLFRLMRLKFNLPVGVALVWITNPLTMPFFYYSFYLCGYYLLSFLGAEVAQISFDVFDEKLLEANGMELYEGLKLWGEFLLIDLGWTMLLGSFLVGIPVALGSYPLTRSFLIRHRTKIAGRMNLTLAEWEDIYVYKTRRPLH